MKNVFLAATVLCLACQPQERNPATITVTDAFAWAFGGDTGGTVRDRLVFVAFAEANDGSTFRVGDWFFASVDVGTPTDATKYGGASHLRFTIQSRPTSFTSYPGPVPVEQAGTWVISDGITILCDPDRKLRVTRTGDSADDITIRIATAGMKHPVVATQKGHISQRYSCIAETPR